MWTSPEGQKNWTFILNAGLRMDMIYHTISPRQNKNNASTVVKDKGNAVVVMDKSSNTQEAERQLSNSKFYQLLSTDPTTKYQKELQDLMKKFPENTCNKILTNTLQESQQATYYLKYTDKEIPIVALASSWLGYLDT